MLTLLLFLQAATFNSYVEEARTKLGLGPIAVQTYSEKIDVGEGPVTAWVPYEPPPRIRVWDTALAQASRDALRIIAYHETCHHYLHIQERQVTDEFQRQLVHELQRYCTVKAMEGDFQRILRKMKNGSYESRLGTVLWWQKQRKEE